MSEAAQDPGAMLARVTAKLDPVEAAWVMGLVMPPWEVRARILAERDDAIRAGLDCFPGLRGTNTADALAAALERYAASAWRFERDLDHLPEQATALRRALHKVLRLNNGNPLGWRQIYNISMGKRG